MLGIYRKYVIRNVDKIYIENKNLITFFFVANFNFIF